MLDFLFDNPVVLFFIIYGLFRLLKGKTSEESAPGKTPTAKPSAPPRTAEIEEARRRAEARRASRRPLEQRLEDLARDWEAKLEGKARPAMRTAPNEPLVAVGESLPFAPVHSEGRTLESHPAERIIENTVGAETGEFDSSARAFEFQPATRESDARTFHLDTFAGFRAAGPRVTTAVNETGDLVREGSPFDGLLNDPDELRRAFILSEVLGKPLALRGRWR